MSLEGGSFRRQVPDLNQHKRAEAFSNFMSPRDHDKTREEVPESPDEVRIGQIQEEINDIIKNELRGWYSGSREPSGFRSRISDQGVATFESGLQKLQALTQEMREISDRQRKETTGMSRL